MMSLHDRSICQRSNNLSRALLVCGVSRPTVGRNRKCFNLSFDRCHRICEIRFIQRNLFRPILPMFPINKEVMLRSELVLKMVLVYQIRVIAEEQ